MTWSGQVAGRVCRWLQGRVARERAESLQDLHGRVDAHTHRWVDTVVDERDAAAEVTTERRSAAHGDDARPSSQTPHVP